MQPVIHYLVRLKLIRRKNEEGELEFIQEEREFRNDIPILARKAAFDSYQSYLDVLLEGKGLRYESDKQARLALKTYYDPKAFFELNDDEINYEDSDPFGNGIGIYMVHDEMPPREKDYKKLVGIHGIGELVEGFFEDPVYLMVSLENEYEIYKRNKYDTDGDEISVIFCDRGEWLEGYREDEPQTYTILRTPFDWSGMDKPYWWGEPEENLDELPRQEIADNVKTWEEIIAEGESNQVEFKPTLLYNHFTNKAGISIKGIIAKSICGFLNARGGFLFIGMNDNGTPQGLSPDFSLAGEKNPKDYFRLQFDDTVRQFLPQSIANIIGQFITIQGIEIFVVIVFPSKNKPVFMKGQHGKEFWVRWTASTRQITDVEEIVNYCLENWGDKK